MDPLVAEVLDQGVTVRDAYLAQGATVMDALAAQTCTVMAVAASAVTFTDLSLSPEQRHEAMSHGLQLLRLWTSEVAATVAAGAPTTGRLPDDEL